MRPQLNQSAIDLIKSCEGLRLTPYKDAVGILTVGYGHTGPDIVIGQKITPEQAEALLVKDLNRICLGVNHLVKPPISDNQFGALISFSYNVGLGNFQSSTLLKLLNNEDYQGAADQFARWNKAGGKELAGLTKRRELERELFLS